MEELFQKLNIKPKDKSLYKTAFSHSSYVNEHQVKNDYERLEFLGDAVLDLIIGEYFYLHFKESEGDMSKERASYVCEDALYEYSKEIGLIDAIRVGNGIQDKRASDGLAIERDSEHGGSDEGIAECGAELERGEHAAEECVEQSAEGTAGFTEGGVALQAIAGADA